MKRLKTFATYILLFVLFFIFSRVLIFIGLNTTYNSIDLKGTIPEGVSIRSSLATSVNGEVKGRVSESLNSKYVKFNFYTDIDTLAGSYYVTPSELEDGDFEFYFKLNHIDSYSVEITDQAPEQINLEDFSLEQYKSHIIFSALLTLLFL